MTSDIDAKPTTDLGLTTTELSWMRSDLANLPTLLASARPSISMMGFVTLLFMSRAL